jgi:hypothetical protein
MKHLHGKAENHTTKKYTITIIMLAIPLIIFTTLPVIASATTTSISIKVSRIGFADPSSPYHPADQNAVTITGMMIDDAPYIKAADVASKLGCVITYYTDNISMGINGQETRAFTYSSYYESCNTYSGVYATPSTTKAFQFFVYGYVPSGYAATLYNGNWYISLPIMKQLGVLVLYQNSSTSYTIYDFRANDAQPEDTNNYIVGGSWLSQGYCFDLDGTFPGYASWAGMATHKLAPNFRISEMRDKSTSSNNPNYFSQLKIAVDLLSSAQQVRYVNNNNSSLTISTCFRSWWFNKDVGGAQRSHHMRGRAFDVGADELFGKVYADFKGNHTTPLAIITFGKQYYWRRQPEVTWSIGDEIETMPRGGDYWLHMQVDPSAQDGVAPQYP